MRFSRALVTKKRVAAGAVVAVVGAVALNATSSPQAEAFDAGMYDGTAYSRAAASCWAIKQLKPDAPSGVYWLQTPQLVAPQKFYCDQSTDGGGWVLIGRGREGWSFLGSGQGSSTTLATTPVGTSAFKPVALPNATVDALLGGSTPDTLPDGVRIRRAADVAGTTWQEVRYRLAPMGGWTWSFGGGVKLTAMSIDGVSTTATGLTARDVWLPTRTGAADNTRRVFSYEHTQHNYRAGFSYGYGVEGANNSTSYLWEYASESMAIPFAQVWIRPRLTQDDLRYTPPTGAAAAATTQRPLMSTTTSADTPWGVTGVVGGGTGETNIEVQALAPVGSTMFVGGKFQYVQKGANPAAGEKIEQSFLAGFDTTTGAWRSGFRPKLDGQVWDIQSTPDGKLIIAGEFTNVNGAPKTRGVAALDPATGAVLPTWRANLTNSKQVTGTKARALDIAGGWLYVGGTFDQISGGISSPKTAYVGQIARVRLADGLPDTTWKPKFNGSIIELDASDRGDRVYVVGRFTAGTAGTIQAVGAAAVTTTSPGELVPGWKQYQFSTASASRYQQMVKELDNGTFWQGGSEHVLQRYNRDTFELMNTNITKRGGDFQSSTVINGILYAGSHGEHYNYSDASTWVGDPIIPTYSRVDSYEWFGAWDAYTGQYLPQFAVAGLRSRGGNGTWELAQGPEGCLWFGGDFNLGSWQGSTQQWLGGFGKVCPVDAQAPSAPGNVTGTRNSTGVTLTWTAARDTSGSVRYEVLRGDRVIASDTFAKGLRFVDTNVPVGTTYWVRAIDAAGNRSVVPAGVTP